MGDLVTIQERLEQAKLHLRQKEHMLAEYERAAPTLRKAVHDLEVEIAFLEA
jgi:hypothetical protein